MTQARLAGVVPTRLTRCDVSGDQRRRYDRAIPGGGHHASVVPMAGMLMLHALKFEGRGLGFAKHLAQSRTYQLVVGRMQVFKNRGADRLIRIDTG